MEGTRMVDWVMWLLEAGTEAMERGCFLDAALSFDLGLVYGQSVRRATASIQEVAAVDNSALLPPTQISQKRDDDLNANCFLFANALTFDERNNHCDYAEFRTLIALAMLNLSISLHRAGLEAGNRAWVSIAKTNYYATLQTLPTVDPARAIQIGVYVYQNLAVLHYMQFEYDECVKCLQHLQVTVEKGVAQSLLDDAVLGKVKMALFFYSQPPTTAGCA